MSLPQNGRDMDRQPVIAGSIRRARERAEAGLPRDGFVPVASPPGSTNNGLPDMSRRLPGARPQAPLGLQGRDGQIGLAISRPTQVPQWPLPSSITGAPAEPYQPPPGRSNPPQRPPRPSRVPSILDGSRIQDHTPVFQYTPQNVRDSDSELASSVPPTPSSRQTVSSVGSIPDFPMPTAAPAPPLAPPPARRSVNLGPPPSARRGASSFYSNVSFVSPIPEESPRSRSHGSFASSAAMPESWGDASPGPSPGLPAGSFGGRDSIYEEDGDESKLVRSASIGKLGKPSIVMNRGVGQEAHRPGPTPLQQDPFADGTGYMESSSNSSGTLPTAKVDARPVPTLGTTMPTSLAPPGFGPDNTDSRDLAPSPRLYSRLSAINRPPKLDVDGTESRASVTSLPDLIRRATRLAAMMDRGRRPASRFDDFDYPDEKLGGTRDSERYSGADDRRQSGLSDMLAAFPPPAQATRQSRVGSFFRQSPSWPLGSNRQPSPLATAARSPGFPNSASQETKKGRRCCGLPLWAFILLAAVILGIIAAAVFVPLEFFVFRNLNGGPFGSQALIECQEQLACSNGGTNVISQDVCSCICTNGFTGANCTISPTSGCTTTNLVSMDSNPNIDNVTLGQAIPRLIASAQSNFSVPLSGTAILARFNTGSLSCVAQNSLVTFEGRSTRLALSNGQVLGGAAVVNNAAIVQVIFESVSVLTELPTPLMRVEDGVSFSVSTIFATTRTFATTIFPNNPTRTTSTTTIPTVRPTPPSQAFVVTEEVLDFARVAVLFILQQDGISDASLAQAMLQRFLTNAGSPSIRPIMDQARNVDAGNGNVVDLLNFTVNTGSGPVGARNMKRSLEMEPPPSPPQVTAHPHFPRNIGHQHR